MNKDTTQTDFYSFWLPGRRSTLMSTHVGDGYDPRGFAEGNELTVGEIAGNSDLVPARTRNTIDHPVYGSSAALIGLGALVFLVLYMDHRIKVRI